MQSTQPDGPKITLNFLCLFVCPHLHVGVFRYPLGGSKSTGRVEVLQVDLAGEQGGATEVCRQQNTLILHSSPKK